MILRLALKTAAAIVIFTYLEGLALSAGFYMFNHPVLPGEDGTAVLLSVLTTILYGYLLALVVRSAAKHARKKRAGENE